MLPHVEARFGVDLPFVESGTAQGDAFGAGLQARAAVGLEVDDVGHYKLQAALPFISVIIAALRFKQTSTDALVGSALPGLRPARLPATMTWPA